MAMYAADWGGKLDFQEQLEAERDNVVAHNNLLKGDVARLDELVRSLQGQLETEKQNNVMQGRLLREAKASLESAEAELLWERDQKWRTFGSEL